MNDLEYEVSGTPPVQGGGRGGGSAREEELQRRERELEQRERDLQNRADHIQKHGRNNWPFCECLMLRLLQEETASMLTPRRSFIHFVPFGSLDTYYNQSIRSL